MALTATVGEVVWMVTGAVQGKASPEGVSAVARAECACFSSPTGADTASCLFPSSHNSLPQDVNRWSLKPAPNHPCLPHPVQDTQTLSFHSQSREAPAGGICQGNVPKWLSLPLASLLPGPGKGNECKFLSASQL